MTVLVAEDHEVNMKMLRFMLEKLDCEVHGAVNGLEAVALFKETHPDLILMDIQMPEMNGFDATREIRKIEEGSNLDRVVISALSANDSPADRQEARNAGMDLFLSKPVKVEHISELLGKAAEKKTLNNKTEGPFDYQEVLNLFSQNKEIVHSLLKDFLDSSKTLVERIDRFVREEDFSSLESSAHSLKGQLLNLRADEASESYARLEKAAREGEKKAIEDAHIKCGSSMAVLVESIKGYLTT